MAPSPTSVHSPQQWQLCPSRELIREELEWALITGQSSTGNPPEPQPVSVCCCFLVAGVSKLACVFFRSRVSVFYSLLVFKPANRAQLPSVGPQGWGAQYVAQAIHSPGWVFVFSSESPPRGTGPNFIGSLPFLSDSKRIFLTVLVVQEFFCQFPISIQRELLHILMCSWGKVSFIFSYSTILI